MVFHPGVPLARLGPPPATFFRPSGTLRSHQIPAPAIDPSRDFARLLTVGPGGAGEIRYGQGKGKNLVLKGYILARFFTNGIWCLSTPKATRMILCMIAPMATFFAFPLLVNAL